MLVHCHSMEERSNPYLYLLNYKVSHQYGDMRNKIANKWVKLDTWKSVRQRLQISHETCVS